MSSASTDESDFDQVLALRLASLRKAAHASQGTLAAELGVDQATVSRIESGQRKVTVGEAFAWLEVLGFGPDAGAAELRNLWNLHGVRPPGFWRDPGNE